MVRGQLERTALGVQAAPLHLAKSQQSLGKGSPERRTEREGPFPVWPPMPNRRDAAEGEHLGNMTDQGALADCLGNQEGLQRRVRGGELEWLGLL